MGFLTDFKFLASCLDTYLKLINTYQIKYDLVVVKMSKVHIMIILTIAKLSVGEISNDSSSDDIQDTSCPFALRSKFGDGSNMFQFVMHGIFLPIVALFGLAGNLVSIFIIP